MKGWLSLALALLLMGGMALGEGVTLRTVSSFAGTDSAALAPYLHRNQLTGEGSVEDGQLWIRFYEIAH